MASAGSFRSLDNSEIENSNLTWRDHEPVMCTSMSQHTKLKATKELGETEERTETTLKDIRLQLAELKDSDETTYKLKEKFGNACDEELVKFLRARKYDVKRTVELMQGYVRYRLNYPDLFTGIELEKIRKRVDCGQPGVLPHRDNEGRVVMFFRVGIWDPVDYPFREVVQTLVYVLERLLQSPVTQINGICLIEDFGDYNMTHVASVGLSDYRRMIDMMQGSFPCRFKGIHCIRQPWFFAKTYNLIKPLLTKAKLLERIYLYAEQLDEFYNHFPKDYLPHELGGHGPEYNGDDTAAMLFDHEGDSDDVTSL